MNLARLLKQREQNLEDLGLRENSSVVKRKSN